MLATGIFIEPEIDQPSYVDASLCLVSSNLGAIQSSLYTCRGNVVFLLVMITVYFIYNRRISPT